MQAANRARILLVFILVLMVPEWIQAQDTLKLKKNGPLQQSLQHLLTQTSDLQPSASPFGRPIDRSPISTHEKFASFLAGEDFKSVLLLQNFRPDLPITFRPTIIASSGEVALAPVTVPAHSSTTVDINKALKDRGLNDTRGTISIRFDFSSYGPGSAVVEIRDDKHHFSLNSYAQSPEEYWSGTTYDAVVWAPHEGTQGFVSITNSSSEVHRVRITFLTKGRSEQQQEVKIAPRQTQVFPIDGLLEQSRKSAAGIHIEYEQGADEEYPGAILVEGQLFNRKTGFAKNIHFMDKALPPTGILRTHFLLLGHQPVEDNFPTDVSFRSVAAIRNIENILVTVTPTVKFLRGEALQAVNLPSRTLGPADSLLIDFNEEQKAGRLPPDFVQGSLELTPDTDRASIVGELFNFGQSGGYVVGPSFSSYPNRSTSSIWRTDGSFQTTVMVENTAAENDRVTLHLYSESGEYSKAFDLHAGELMKINLRDLQENSIPDDNGKLLADTSGVMSLVASRNASSKLSYDKIIHSTDQSDYVGLPANPCDYVTVIGMWIDSSPANQPFPVMKTYFWSQSGPADAPQAGSGVSNSSVAHISNNGSGDMITFTPPDNGQTFSVTISPPFPQELTSFCDACSSGDVTVVAAVVSGIRLADTFWKNPTSSAQGCFYASLACTPPTQPTCTTQVGIGFGPSGSCASFVHAQTLVVGSTCFGPSLVTAAGGPGTCN
jgi:hypothetical protein